MGRGNREEGSRARHHGSTGQKVWERRDQEKTEMRSRVRTWQKAEDTQGNDRGNEKPSCRENDTAKGRKRKGMENEYRKKKRKFF